MGKLCGECGKREMVLTNVNGRSDFNYKDYPSVKINTDLELLVCKNCGNVGLMSGDSKKLDEALVISIKQQSTYLIKKILENHNCEQQKLADHIGITPEHLSQIKNGKMIPSFQTFNFLKTIAFDKTAFEVSSPDFKFDYKVAMVINNPVR